MSSQQVSNINDSKPDDVPQPKTPAMPIAVTIAQGTAVAALEASSEICTLQSNPQIVHRGARKLSMKAYPLVHPSTVNEVRSKTGQDGLARDLRFVKFPRAKLAVFLNSFGVAIGKAIMTAKERLRAAGSQSDPSCHDIKHT
jgi:hypothetical protein